MTNWLHTKIVHRRQPIWLRDAIKELKSTPNSKMKVVEWRQKDKGGAGTLFVMTERTFRDWHGK